ncbi:hypothetical protein ACFO0M_10310 [Micromonospora mangrovi]|uniref:Transcriptional regulator, AbiEi antitoxin, Type IV TA system n=2 Tax=Micromonospora TaxID=1873 RepID=A0AAU8HDQ2_9ACTN
MPPAPHRPAELAGQVFRGSDVVRRGLLTRHQLRGASWLRLRQDVYADARLDRDHRLACRAALLRLPPGTLIAGPSAAHLHGVEHAAGFDDDVHVLVTGSTRVDPQAGLRVHRLGAPRHAPATFPVGGAAGRSTARYPGSPGAGSPEVGSPGAGGPAHTGPAECAWETAVWIEPFRAVGIVDTLLRRGLLGRDELAEVADRRAGWPGSRRAGWVFGLTDPASGSPAESHLRVRLVLGGLPRPVARHPVRLGTGVVLRPGLAWPRFRVAIQYDAGRRALADRPPLGCEPLDGLVGAGWRVVPVTDHRLRRQFPAVQAEVCAALRAGGWRP